MNTSKVDKEKLQSKKIKGGGVNLFISYLLLIVTTIAIIIFLGCQFGCKKNDNTPPTPATSIIVTTNYSTLNSTTTSNNVATITANITNPVGNTTWSTTPSGYASYATFVGTTSDATIVTATLTYNTYVSIDVTITAMNNGKSNSCMVTLKPEPATPIYSLPVNSIFYTFSGTQGEVVEGFSTNFLTASDTDEHARQYMVDNADWGVSINDTFGISMDLHGQKITTTGTAFSQLRGTNANINHIFRNLGYLNFTSTLWQWNGYYGDSGSETFKGADFSNVKMLNLHDANFAIDDDKPGYNDLVTAYHTFANAIFTNLITLDLSGAIFATNLFNNLGTETALGTFYNATFTSLETLDLSNTTFAVADTHDDAYFSTAYNTFNYATLAELHTINLGNCQLGNSHSGTNTIDNTCFSDLNATRGWNDTTNKLQISGSWDWESNASDQLNTWFGDGCWDFDLIS